MRGFRRGWAALLLAATGGVAGLGPVLLATAGPAWAFTAPVDILKLGSGKFAFDPKVTEINMGDKVLWRNNKSGARHTVTSDPGNAPFDSGELPDGGTFEWKFREAGTYTYHCEHHPEMTGRIEVKDPNAPTTTTTAPPPPTTVTTAPPTTTTTAPPTTTTEPPTTTTTAPRPPAGVPTPPVPDSAAAPPPAPTTSSVPSTTTTTTAPPATASSAPPVLAGEPPGPAPGPPAESSTTTAAPTPGETGDRIPTAAGPISRGDDGKLDVATVALVSLLVLVGAFGAWTLIRVRPGRV